MKRVAVLLIIFGIWSGLAFGRAAYAADFLLPDAGVYTFVEKPSAPGFTIRDVEGRQVRPQGNGSKKLGQS